MEEVQFNKSIEYNYVTDHVHIDWTIDFTGSVLRGFVLMKFKNIMKDKSDLKLNIRNLYIMSVDVNGEDVQFNIETISKKDVLGKALTIPINTTNDEFEVKIIYNTTDKSTALQWMKPEATKGKTHPYLYSQCQAIHARSLLPCQDDPSVKFTYTAEVRGPDQLEVLMSAVKTDEPEKCINQMRLHKFEQKICIPSYLIAIVCGNLEGRRVGPRCKVWSEPEMVEEAADEFRDTEKLLSLVEKVCGSPFVWTNADLLILPPSFPYGGMENPCLTFLTPTLIVGDRSLVTTVAHELAHSWTGNLVTNRTWADFWLNEGHTRYVERLVMELFHGGDERMRHSLILSGIAALQESLNIYGKGHNFNQLIPDITDCDPDDAFSRVPYEKGSNLLFHLETVCGKDKMLRWLQAYLNHFKYKSLTTTKWKDYFYYYMIEKENVDKTTLDAVNWEEWFHGRWTIPVEHNLNREYSEKSEKLANTWITLSDADVHGKLLAPSSGDSLHKQLLDTFNNFRPEMKYYFFHYLNDMRDAKFSSSKMMAFCKMYGLSNTKNSELQYGWAMLVIRSKYEPGLPQVYSFLNSQGRLRFSKTIYKALYEWPEQRESVLNNFQKHKPSMHPILAKMLRKILEIPESVE